MPKSKVPGVAARTAATIVRVQRIQALLGAAQVLENPDFASPEDLAAATHLRALAAKLQALKDAEARK